MAKKVQLSTEKKVDNRPEQQHRRHIYTLKTEVLKITLEASFLTLPKSAKRDNTRSVTQTPREVSRS